MARKTAGRDRDDDFVLTVNDDAELSAEQSGEEDQPEVTGSASKKRKRESPTHLNGNSSRSKKTKVQPQPSGSSDEEEEDEGWAQAGEDDGALASDFEFQVGETTGLIEDFDGWEADTTKAASSAQNDAKGVDIDDIISRRRERAAAKSNGATNGRAQEKDGSGDKDNDHGDMSGVMQFDDDDEELLAADAFGMGAGSDSDNEDGDSQDEANAASDDDSISGSEDDDDVDDSDAESEVAPVAHPDDVATSDSEEEEDEVEAERRAAFFAPEDDLDVAKTAATKVGTSFQAMQLSRPILKGLAAVGFSEPTPIQLKTIPVALLGKDVVGGAVTGSGKTGAFIIPILERLLYRPKKVPTTRVAILMPTRELAVQCFNVAKKLASFTDITFAQIVGGFSVREQENVLRSRPDVIIATPGRFIDHMRNSASFAVDTLEILVLDEADRMLEDGFADELNEILTTIPKSRQTMLFSATMTDSVDKLIRVGLNRPVRLMVDAKKQTVSGLVQEFLRLRPGREDKRLAYLMYLCDEIYSDRVIVFFRQKKEAHRVRVVFSLCGLKAAELHGSMSQEQRIASVEAFRNGSAKFLLATDLASRGLDIKGVATVINYEAPQTHEIYLHRVGRTARAGRTGQSCTLAAEPDRKVVKAAVKAARAQGARIASRVVPAEAADAWAERLRKLEDEIAEVLAEEKEEKALTVAERQMKKGENIMQHEAEIMSRPKRTWFESEKDKKAAKDAGRKELNPDTELKGKKEKKKLSNKDKKKLLLKDERTEGRMWKKGSQDRGKNARPPSRNKSKEKAKMDKSKARFIKKVKN